MKATEIAPLLCAAIPADDHQALGQALEAIEWHCSQPQFDAAKLKAEMQAITNSSLRHAE